MLRRRRHHVGHNTSNERWLISYADFVTLLFAFFVMMYSVSHVNEQKYQQLSNTLEALFSSQEVVTENSIVVDDLLSIKDSLSTSLSHEMEAGNIIIEKNEFWLEISLNNRILFDSASVSPSEQARHILQKISQALLDSDYPIQVEGFTDDVAINTAQYPSNWELSSARAAAVVKLLVQQGINPSRLAAVGYGQYQPITDNTTEAGRALNRRISLMVGKHLRHRPITEPNKLPETPSIPTVSPSQQKTSSGLTPVILENGEYLFSSDPDLPRHNARQ